MTDFTTYEHAWRLLEQLLRANERESMAKAIERSRDEGLLDPETATFLDRVREFRNALTHVPGHAPGVPLATPTAETVERLEGILSLLTGERTVWDVAHPLCFITADTSVAEALVLMHRHDYTHLPYRSAEGYWRVFTRKHVAVLLERQAGSGVVNIDLQRPASQVVPDLRCDIAIVSATAGISRAVELLEGQAMSDTPALLLTCLQEEWRILTVPDLRLCYRLLP